MLRISTLSFSPKILVLAVATWLLLGSPGILGQVGNAVVVGRIRDSSGAVVVGAQVEVKRLSTNQAFRTLSTETGDYRIGDLPIDTYEIRVSAGGFNTEVRTGIRLEVGRTSRFDFDLAVGNLSQAVAVTAEAPILKTETPEFGQIIDNSKIVSLPLNGRDILGSFSSLTPGVAPGRGTGLGSGLFFTVRGQRRTDNLVYLDGGQTSAPHGQSTFYISPDAVEEFEIKTGLYGAECGFKPGGQFNVITKSGTNTPHGTLFESLRNNALDARSFFDPGPRPPYKRNQFGAVFGGPVYFPKLFNGKDKAWFLVSYSATRTRNFQSLTGVVPTPDEKAGRFSRAITDPLTGQPFPNNTIATSRFNPVALKFLPFWPDPNTPPGRGFNFTSPNSTSNSDLDQVVARLDFKVSDTNRWWGRFLFDTAPITQSATIEMFTRSEPFKTWSQSVNNTRTFMGRIVNTFGFFFYQRPYLPGAPSSSPRDFGTTLGIPGFPATESDTFGVPLLSVTGLVGLGDGGQYGISTLGTWELRDNVTFNRGSHSFKAGYHWRRSFNHVTYNNRSTFSFTSLFTGSAFANLLLGYPSNAAQGADGQRGRYAQDSHSSYFEDSWKATGNLTVTLARLSQI